MPQSAWQTIIWREGTNTLLSDRFAILRVQCANGDGLRADPLPEEWLIIEWPEAEKNPTRFWLSTLPDTISPVELIRLTKMRWRIERDYQGLKQECGLGHYEGRNWVGLHHHITLCIAAYGFLVSQAEAIPPSAPQSRNPLSRQKPSFSKSYIPKNSPVANPAPCA